MCTECGYPGDSHFVMGVAYPADAVDGHGEYMTAHTVQNAAWGFLQRGNLVGFQHEDGTLGHAQVVESTIYRGPTYEVEAADGSKHVVKNGDWLLGAVFDAKSWPSIRAGNFTGWSIQGLGIRNKETDEGH